MKQQTDNNENEEEDRNLGVNEIFLREKLQTIKTACAAFDRNRAKAALEELKTRKWSKKINSLLDEISLNLLHSAFKKTAAAVDNFLW